MKIGLALLLVIGLPSCESHNREVFLTITSVDFLPATTYTWDENPALATSPIPANHFSIQLNFEFEQSGNGDAFEDQVNIVNPIDTFKIWSPQTFSGRIPYASLNTLFKNRISPSNIVQLEEDGELEFNTTPQSLQEPLPKTAYLLSTNTSITPGNYDFYFYCKFKDGTTTIDVLSNVEIQ